jgi:uncharacterized protein (UPF0303 family)
MALPAEETQGAAVLLLLRAVREEAGAAAGAGEAVEVRLLTRESRSKVVIDVTRIDKHLTFLASEITNLRNRSETWAQRKADQWEALRQDLQKIRQDRQMTGIGGKRIEG